MTREEAIAMLKSKMDGSVDTSYEWAETVRMAIEALKSDSVEVVRCSECKHLGISDEINEMNKEIIKDILKMMPTAYLLEALGVATFEELTEQADSPHGEWIPIATEPNTADHVLVTYKWDDDDYEVSELDYWVTEYEAEKGNEKCKWLIDHVTAWMPLPKPYKGGDTK